MPVKDLTRWSENEDGSWSRIVSTESVKIGIEDLADPIEEVAAEVLVEETEEAPTIVEAIDIQYDATSGAKEAAAKLGIDLATVTGTGLEGRITKADVEAAAA